MKKGWEVKKLGEVCKFFNGQAHEKCIDEDGKYKLINSKFISSEGNKFKRTNNALSPLFVNDIVMVMSDVPNGKTLAKCFVVDKDNTYTLNQRICVIRSKHFDTRFLYYQINRNKYLVNFDNGENQSNLRKDDILNCELLLPPLQEQQRIVAILDNAFTAISKLKANAEQNLNNSRELFESYLQGVLENRGEGWEEKRLGEVLKLEYGKPLSDEKRTPDGLYPIYGANGEKGKSNEFYHDKQTIVIGRKGSAGEINLTEEKFWPLDVTYFITFNEHKYNLLFLYYLLTLLKLPKLAKGVKPGINRNEVYDINILLPPLQEQQAIVAKLDALSAETKKLESIYQHKINNLEELKKSILQKTFNGELKTEKDLGL